LLLLFLLPEQRYTDTYHPKRSTDSSTGTNHIERLENVILLNVALKDEGVWVCRIGFSFARRPGMMMYRWLTGLGPEPKESR